MKTGSAGWTATETLDSALRTMDAIVLASAQIRAHARPRPADEAASDPDHAQLAHTGIMAPNTTSGGTAQGNLNRIVTPTMTLTSQSSAIKNYHLFSARSALRDSWIQHR